MEQLTWLNEKLLSKVVDSPETDIEITRHEVEPAVPLGENYFSAIHRVTVYFRKKHDGKEESFTFITKSFPGGVMSEILQEFKTMEKELNIYRTIIPLVESSIGVLVTPESYCTEKDEIVILEDLRVKGYKMADRVKQLDHQHCVRALQSLAKFQAGSVVLHDKRPELFEIVDEETVYKTNGKVQASFVENAFKLLAEEIEHWPGLEHLALRLRAVSESIVEKVIEAIKPSSPVNVLNHGDFWTNNLLYHNKGDEIIDVRIIDWQMCRWTTPAMDLQMFFYSSVRDLNSIRQLTEVYLSTFNETLARLGSQQILSSEQLKEDLQRTACFGLVVAVSLLPICVGERDKPMDFSETTIGDFTSGFAESNPYAGIYKGLCYKDRVPAILNMFIEKNVL